MPQYHRTPENDKWWGENYTEWNTVKNAKKYSKTQVQPKHPLDDNYYNLDDDHAVDTLTWQAQIAKCYGVYGFCFYHYWFKDGKQMLYKPMEILRNHEEININYCICWANEPWRRTWYAGNSEILIDQDYGNASEWEAHYKYLSGFFSDKRYIFDDGQPVVFIYRSAAIEHLDQMLEVWNRLAMEDGYNGIYVISERTAFAIDTRSDLFSAYCDFEPAYSLHYRQSKLDIIMRLTKRQLFSLLNLLSRTKKYLENTIEYDKLTRLMGNDYSYRGKKVFPGICPSWDNTPRKSEKGMFLKGATPSAFQSKLEEIVQGRTDSDYLLINAWNEWGEGACLEPDSSLGYGYLEAIRKVMKS